MSEKRVASAENLPGEEDLRFIRNFHDIFLSIGIAMFAGGLALATAIALGPKVAELFQDGGDKWRQGLGLVAAAAGVNAAIMWLMGEFFARGRRLFLPSIVILLAFVWFFQIFAAATYAVLTEFDPGGFQAQIESLPREGADRGAVSPFAIFPPLVMNGLLVTMGATAAAIFIFYFRMKLPFAMGLGASVLAGLGTLFVFRLWPERIDLYYPVQLAAGVFMFLLGLVYDATDVERRTRRSDNAFWLHFFAAPTILGSAVGLAVGPMSSNLSMLERPQTASVVVLLLVLGFAFISLLINRRALLVAGLLYALIAGGYLISKTGLNEAWTAAVTLLVLGGAMVLLGGGWHTLRRIVVAPFPKRGLIARIIPPEPSKEERVRSVSE